MLGARDVSRAELSRAEMPRDGPWACSGMRKRGQLSGTQTAKLKKESGWRRGARGREEPDHATDIMGDCGVVRGAAHLHSLDLRAPIGSQTLAALAPRRAWPRQVRTCRDAI